MFATVNHGNGLANGEQGLADSFSNQGCLNCLLPVTVQCETLYLSGGNVYDQFESNNESLWSILYIYICLFYLSLCCSFAYLV